MRLVFASNNAHKLEEVRGIMPAGIEVLSLRDIGFESEIEETGTTLEENSAIKAEAVYHWILDNGHLTLDGVFADDTGLEIDALGGAPGVYTARWYRMNESTSEGVNKLTNERDIFAANIAKALTKLKGKTERGAQFKTVITLIRDERVIQVAGVVRGRIAEEAYGKGGFGYDPVFIPEGYDKTFAELPAETKNHISHRARALEKLTTALT